MDRLEKIAGIVQSLTATAVFVVFALALLRNERGDDPRWLEFDRWRKRAEAQQEEQRGLIQRLGERLDRFERRHGEVGAQQ